MTYEQRIAQLVFADPETHLVMAFSVVGANGLLTAAGFTVRETRVCGGPPREVPVSVLDVRDVRDAFFDIAAAVERGDVTLDQIDDAVRHVLRESAVRFPLPQPVN